MPCRHSCCHCTVADDSSPHGIASLSLSIGLKGTTGLSLKETDSLRSRAMEIKRLMRVQMADEEDLLSVSLAYSLYLSHLPFYLSFSSSNSPFQSHVTSYTCLPLHHCTFTEFFYLIDTVNNSYVVRTYMTLIQSQNTFHSRQSKHLEN
jgi:hypothetical protein